MQLRDASLLALGPWAPPPPAERCPSLESIYRVSLTVDLCEGTGKIPKLRLSLTSHPATSSPHSPSPHATPPNFSVFTPASESEVYKILSNCPNKQSDSDPIPTWLLKECSSLLVPTITNIVNLSLITGQFHPTLKESIISPLLKKPTLDNEELSNYRPISNLSLISKIIERVVKSRLMDHLTSNSLLNSLQSAYCKHHSTETALVHP